MYGMHSAISTRVFGDASLYYFYAHIYFAVFASLVSLISSGIIIAWIARLVKSYLGYLAAATSPPYNCMLLYLKTTNHVVQ